MILDLSKIKVDGQKIGVVNSLQIVVNNEGQTAQLFYTSLNGQSRQIVCELSAVTFEEEADE